MESEEIGLDDYFEIRSANDWLRAAKTVPVPKMLFGEMWFEGEIAIMFGDTGVGKSALAVQIGEAIARGRAVGPMTTTARPQTVLYLDFELSAKQFEMRYAGEFDASRGDHLKNHYRFSDRLKRVAIKPEVFRQDGDLPFETAVRRLVEPLIERTGARVLIVDNITYLKRTADNSRDAAPLMKELKRLKEQFGLSILVIAHTPKRDIKRPLVLNDMQGSKVIANFADSVFAIGQSRRESNERYIKHIKQRSSELLHGSGHLPVFRMGKLGGNFLGLEFRRYASEHEMLQESADSHAWATIQRVKDMTDAGLPIRQIAEQLGLSKSAAHRYLQMWHPHSSPPYEGRVGSGSPPYEGGVDAALGGRGGSLLYTAAGALPPDNAYNPPVEDYSFPGREEYDEAAADRRFDDLFADETPENYLLRREAYLIEAARARARREYLKTGVAPRLNDDPDYREFMSSLADAAFHSSPPYEGGVRLLQPGGGSLSALDDVQGEPKLSNDNRLENHPDRPKRRPPLLRKEGSLETATSPNPLDHMELVVDDYGKERFVESRYENGKLRVWYQSRSDGALLRWEHSGFGSTSDLADPAVFGKYAGKRETAVPSAVFLVS